MKAGLKILDSEGKTGLELLNSASKVQFCDSGRGGEKLLGEKQLDSLTEKPGADEEGANEKSAKENREVEKERRKVEKSEREKEIHRGVTSKEFAWGRNQRCFKGLGKLCNCFFPLFCPHKIMLLSLALASVLFLSVLITRSPFSPLCFISPSLQSFVCL